MWQEDGIDRRALFSDETPDYREPSEPMPGDHVCIRFRTAAGNAERVFLIAENDDIETALDLVSRDELFDIYETVIGLSDEIFAYCFRIEAGQEKLWYLKTGVSQCPDWEYAFRISPGFKTPDWAKGAIMYQIFVDRFCNGTPENDVREGEYIYGNNTPVHHIDDWNRYPAPFDVNNFYGGDLQGVMQKLDYLQDLGVEVIYFNPLFVSPSNHKYDIQDYDYIDPHFAKIVNDTDYRVYEGASNRDAHMYIKRVADKENLEASNAYFAELVEAIHARGMKVIIDGVFNHCGSFNKWMDREQIYEAQQDYARGAYVAGDSPYRGFFGFTTDSWPCNGDYEGWWGFETLPKLNYEGSKELYDYIMYIGRKWVSPPYNADGWRLDVAADLGHSEEFNHTFWRDFRRNVKEANPNAIILAEHYGDPRAWLKGDQWDTVMNYDAFMEPLTWFLTGMEKHSDGRNDALCGDGDRFFETMNTQMSRFYGQSLQVAMNELSNHDHSRFLTRTNKVVGRTGTLGPEAANNGIDKGLLYMAVAVQMTWPGAPTIYYGDEAGVCGFTDPDSRRTYPWGHEDLKLLEYHKYMTRIRKNHSALRTGSYKPLLSGRGLICYGRFNSECFVVTALNQNDYPIDIEIPVWELGADPEGRMQRIMFTYEDNYNSGRMEYTLSNGHADVNMPAKSSMIFAGRTLGADAADKNKASQGDEGAKRSSGISRFISWRKSADTQK